MQKSHTVVGTNIHRPSEKAPLYSTNSKFFLHAQAIEKIEQTLASHSTIHRQSFSFPTPPLLTSYLQKTSTGNVLDLTPHMSDWPKNVTLPAILIFDTPENNAMTLGRLAYDTQGKLSYQPARYHTGIPAQEDISIAMQQAVYAPAIQRLLGNPATLPERMFITYLTREGHLTDWHRALYYAHNVTVPYSVVHAEHAQDPSIASYARVTKICPINLEGLIPDAVEILVVGDNTASGMQHVAVIEELVSQIKQKQNKSRLKQILIISPLLTLYGASCIARFAAHELNLPVTFIVSGAILGCNPPDRYFSPILGDANLIANPSLLPINNHAYGTAGAGLACVRCNWTASFLAPVYALSRSNEELSLYGTNDAKIRASCQELTVEKIRSLSADLTSLVPYSTLHDARLLGKEKELHDLTLA